MINPLSVQQYSKTDSVLRNLIYALNLTSTFQDLPLLVTNNKDEDQTARTRCLITVFVIRCLEGMTDSLATSRSLSYEPWFNKIRYM